MAYSITRLRVAIGTTALICTAALAGCGAKPETKVVTTQQTTTTAPPPVISTTSTTTEQRETPEASPIVHRRHPHYAAIHRRIHRSSETFGIAKTTTTETTVTPGLVTETARKSTETTTTR